MSTHPRSSRTGPATSERGDPQLSAGIPVKQRYAWVDTAKGAAILLVVLFHATIFLTDVELSGDWDRLAITLDTFRMPLFFFTAGLFAPKAIAAPFTHLFRRRVALLLWVYGIWTIAYTIIFQILPPGAARPPTWLDLLLAPVWPNESTWFVYGLALYFMAAWLIRALPLWAQFAPAIALSVGFGTNYLDTGNTALDKIGIYFVYFLAAAHFGRFALAIAGRLAWWHSLLVVAVYATALLVVYRLRIFYAPGVRTVLGVLAIGAGVSMAVALSALPWMSWLTALGSRTLPIYLLHMYPILLIAAALRPFAGTIERYDNALPPLLTLIAVIIALGVHRLTRRVPGMYALPRRLQWDPAKTATPADRDGPPAARPRPLPDAS